MGEWNHRASRGGWRRRQAAKNTGGKVHEAGVSFLHLLVIYIMFTNILSHLIYLKLHRMAWVKFFGPEGVICGIKRVLSEGNVFRRPSWGVWRRVAGWAARRGAGHKGGADPCDQCHVGGVLRVPCPLMLLVRQSCEFSCKHSINTLDFTFLQCYVMESEWFWYI